MRAKRRLGYGVPARTPLLSGLGYAALGRTALLGLGYEARVLDTRLRALIKINNLSGIFSHNRNVVSLALCASRSLLGEC